MYIYRTKWAKKDGILYKNPCVLTIGVEDDYPQFGRLESVFIADSNSVYFHVRLMKTLEFNVHRHLYLVDLTSSYKTVCFTHLYYPFPLHLSQHFNLFRY